MFPTIALLSLVLVDAVLHARGVSVYQKGFISILRAYEETTYIEKGHGQKDNNFYCRKCASLVLPEDIELKFDEQKCDANELYFEEFYVGICCENTSRWTNRKHKKGEINLHLLE